MNLRLRLLFAAMLMAAPAKPVRADDEPLPRQAENLSIRNEVSTAIDKSLGWLLTQQKPDGSWGTADLPALTGLTLLAILNNPRLPADRAASLAALRQGLAFLRSQAKPDGGIYGRGLVTYNTAVCLAALVRANLPEDDALTARANAFLISKQAQGGLSESSDGGFGYGVTGGGAQRDRPDLSNTAVALEALRAYAQAHPLEEKAGPPLNWKAALEFISRCQNLPATNPEKWASDDSANRGGFIYYPGHSDAGETDLGHGRKGFRSYGSMSYAGLLSFIYADLKPSDPRVTSALAWLTQNYSLAENPNLGQNGYYYYLHLLAKGLAAADVNEIQVKGSAKIDWAHDLALQLINTQSSAGTWVNRSSSRWMENDPQLVTAFGVLTLEIVFNRL